MAVQNEANMSEILSGVKSVPVDRVREVVDGAVRDAAYMRDEMSAMRSRPEITRTEPEARDTDAEYMDGLAASVAATEAAAPESSGWKESEPASKVEEYGMEDEQEEGPEQDFPDF